MRSPPATPARPRIAPRRDQAYADAMRAAVSSKFPDDQDVATLYAESLMDLSPWNYWSRGRRAL